MSVQFRMFEFDPEVEIAPVIYKDTVHKVTPCGAAVSAQVQEELLAFVRQYADFVSAGPNPYFRLDVYVADGKLWVLEANSAFVDGWGVALNLSRAVNAAVATDLLHFPICLGLVEAAYRPELELLITELEISGSIDHRLCEQWQTGNCHGPVYVYGRVEGDYIWPQGGLRLDDKMNLARFSREWQGNLVMTPVTHTHEVTDWSDVPSDVFLKFVDKSSAESQRARFSVAPGKPTGKSPFIRRCYNAGSLIAQQRIYGDKVLVESQERQVQLVILSNTEMLTGYVQFGLGSIINDNSIHGPLVF